MRIEADFECGNAIVEQVSDTEAVINIRPDSNAQYFQWFHFRVTGEAGKLRTFTLANAKVASYPHAWNGYRALASYNGTDWFRVQTCYTEGKLTIRHRATQTSTTYTFFVPYFEAQREQLLDDCAKAGERRLIVNTPNNRPVEMIVFGNPNAKRKAWVIARQHAGEPMAEYCIDGLMRRLADGQDELVKQLFEADIAFFCIPNVNPDGSAFGNLRANAAGIDLNRDWKQGVEPKSVEVGAILRVMEAEGVDFFYDIHGDEASQYVWLVQPHAELIVEDNKPLQEGMETFVRERYAEYGPDPIYDIPANENDPLPKPADTGMAIDYVAWRFKCPSLIVELPFKDTIGADTTIDSLLAAGCEAFGRDSVEMIAEVLLGK
ncbi:MAG: hypothetical protein LCI00_32515 [Chloroflexi bacterium]|nr:hypothetical protein [Chloroflexota bacterium]MCC6894664.1 hypothetical protein [Anaerolineae bacterium]